MSEIPQNEGGSSTVRNILLVLAGIYIIASVVFVVQVFSRIDDLERKQVAAQEELSGNIAESESQTRASVGVLAEQIGITRQDLAKRAAVLQRKEKAIESRLSVQEEQTKQQFGAVSGEVSGVRTDVGKVRDDVTATRSRSEEHTSELQSRQYLVCRLLLEKKKKKKQKSIKKITHRRDRLEKRMKEDV